MPINRVIFDWNGTLIENADEAPLWRFVANETKNRALRRLNVPKIISLIAAKKELEELKKGIDRDGKPFTEDYRVQKMYDIFNEHVLSGLPRRFLLRAITEYANEAMERLDKRMIYPVLDNRSLQTKILSTGCREAIIETLGAVLYGTFISPRNITANTIKYQDRFNKRVSHFAHGEIDKPKILNRYSRLESTAYVDDREDGLPCFEIVAERGGYPVVSFYATDSIKQKAAKDYGAFAPESQDDWRDFLLKS